MIFYFSGTGNTRWAANKLAEATEEKLVNIAECIDKDCVFSLNVGERLGFCFPVHGWRPPMIVRNFIKNFTIRNAAEHYCYAVCTAGDDIGETIKILRNDLKIKGIQLCSAFSLIMPESYVGLPFMDVDSPEKEMRKKDKAAADLRRYSKIIINRQEGVEELVTGNWPKINSQLLGGFFTNYLITDKPFHVAENKCIKCGKCADSCQINNILCQKGSFPVWRRNGSCLACFACYHHCPTHAIEYGDRTKHKGQYYFDKLGIRN